MTKGILHFEDLDPKMFEAMCCNIIAVISVRKYGETAQELKEMYFPFYKTKLT